MAICSICEQNADCRMFADIGAFGPEDVQTCKTCHDKEVKKARAEAKRFGFRTKIKTWDKLTKNGCYSEVQ